MKCALVKDSTSQVFKLGDNPNWESSPPPGFSAEEVNSLVRPDAEYDNDPQGIGGKLIVGSFSIICVDNKNLRRFTNAEIDAGLLSVLKKWVGGKVNSKTEELLEEGFEYPTGSGKYFGLDIATQLRAFGSDYVRNWPEYPYPVIWNTKDDTDTVSLEDADAVRDFFKKGMVALRVKIDSGTTIKEQIRQAATAAEVLAIVDPR